MTFTMTISRPPLALAVEVGSISEGIGILQDSAAELTKMFDIKIGEMPEGTASGEGDTKEKKERKPRAGKDPAAAVAPPPAPIPGAAPVDTTLNDAGIPKFLERAAAPPPPPVLPAAPPVAPAAPPAPMGVLAGKVVAELDRRAAGSADQGKGLADWLAACGVSMAGASYTEAVGVVRLLADDKLGAVAAGLQIA